MAATGTITSVERRRPARRRAQTIAQREAFAVRRADGKRARERVPVADHAVFEPTSLRADPVELLHRQAPSRVPHRAARPAVR